MSTDSTEIGRRIAALRQRLGLSQVAFARRTGISRNALVAYERGGRLAPERARATGAGPE